MITETSTRQYIHHGILYSCSYLESKFDGDKFKTKFQITMKNISNEPIMYDDEFYLFRCSKNDVIDEKVKVSQVNIIEDINDCMNRKHGDKGQGLKLLIKPLVPDDTIIFSVELVSKVLNKDATGTANIINANQDSPLIPSVGTITFNGNVIFRKKRKATAITLEKPWIFKQFSIDGLIKVTEHSKVCFHSGDSSDEIYLPGPFSRDDMKTHLNALVNGNKTVLGIDFSKNHIECYNSNFAKLDKIEIFASSFTSV